MNAKRGSSTVEAAIVFPLIILIAAALIAIGSDNCSKVREDSDKNIAAAELALDQDLLTVENIMRGRWILR
ncbi:MAG: hypothetical protein K6E42_06505 [Synergistes sp.]|nr:hypothetical protein [Synergistes sp.]